MSRPVSVEETVILPSGRCREGGRQPFLGGRHPGKNLFFEQGLLFGFSSNSWVSPAVGPSDLTVGETYAVSVGRCRGGPSMRNRHIGDSEKSHSFS